MAKALGGGVAMRHLLAWLAGAWVLAAPAGVGAAEGDAGPGGVFRGWSVSLATPSVVIICRGFSCTLRTETGLGAADHACFAELMTPGKAPAKAERAAIAKPEEWFEKRIAPKTGTASAKARAGGILGYSRD